MLLNEFNLKALNVSAESVLPVSKIVSVEGYEITLNVTAFQTGYGSGKKTVISGSVLRKDNGVEKLFENADIEKIRRVVASLCDLTQNGRTTNRKPRAMKEQTEVEKLRASLAVARRLPNEWITIDANKLRAAFLDARKKDKAPQELATLTQLDAEKQLKAYELLKKAGLIS